MLCEAKLKPVVAGWTWGCTYGLFIVVLGNRDGGGYWVNQFVSADFYCWDDCIGEEFKNGFDVGLLLIMFL